MAGGDAAEQSRWGWVRCLLVAAGASRRATQKQSVPRWWWYSYRAWLQRVGRVQRAEGGRRAGVRGRDGGKLGAGLGWLQCVGRALERTVRV